LWRICRQLKQITKGDIHYYYGQRSQELLSPQLLSTSPPFFQLLHSLIPLGLSDPTVVPWSWYFWSGAFCQGDLSPLSAWHSLIFDWAKKGKRQKDVLRLCCLLSLVLLKLHQIQAAGVATSVEDLMVD